MSCDPFRHELLAPTGAISDLDLARHRAACPDCDALAQGLTQLDQAWNQTRPAEPDPAHWAPFWTQVTHQADTPALVPVRSSRSQRTAALWAFAAVAQAAAVLLAGWIFLRSPATQVAQPNSANEIAQISTSPAQEVEYVLDEGQTLFLELADRGDSVVVRPRFVATDDLVAFDGDIADPFADAYQTNMIVLNTMEGMEWP